LANKANKADRHHKPYEGKKITVETLIINLIKKLIEKLTRTKKKGANDYRIYRNSANKFHV
jgi:hypothetical protein